MTKKKSKDNKSIKLDVFPKIDLHKMKLSKIISLEGTKKKIGNFYSNYKKEKEREEIRAEKNRKLDEKRELLRQKKQEQKERLDKLKEEKRQIIAQRKLVTDNEKQVRKNEEKKRHVLFKTILSLHFKFS